MDLVNSIWKKAQKCVANPSCEGNRRLHHNQVNTKSADALAPYTGHH